MWRVLGNILYDLDPKVKGQIMYFLINASPEGQIKKYACLG